ncbi:hypothetical protein H4R35_002565 [Dimargaris xerosporica]|nr:hypothetical protein H4R35_002565 [Dimargaris xerosporica]
MVLYFQSTAVSPPAMVYMGKDKYENEELIKHGWDEDVWFHVDKLSSAHVYLRMTAGQTWDNLPEALVTDLAQLTKANSIEGQVSFHNFKLVKRVMIESRVNEIINRLNKTKEIKDPDLYAEKQAHLREIAKAERKVLQQQKLEEDRLRQEYKKQKELQSYAGIFDDDEIEASSNRNNTEDLEDDFM